MLWCSGCREMHAAEDFSIDRNRKRGRNVYCKAAVRERYLANRGAVREQQRSYYQATREYHLERKKTYTSEHPEVREAWETANPDYHREWRANNHDDVLEAKWRRRARERGAFVEDVERAVVWERDQGICGICSQPADADNWHLDHVIPLARGGLHCYANTQVSHPACNFAKRDRMPQEVSQAA